jgi:putative ABC transport system permease protein
VRRLDPVVDVMRAGSALESLDESLWPTRMAAKVLSGFSVLAMLMTAAGLFGLMAHHVEQRRHEIGLRMALGSTSEAVARVFLMRGARLAAVGVVLGIAAALALTRLMAGLLSGVSSSDPWTYGGVAVVLMLVALLSSWAPARRAARVDPISALRGE